jgi:putative transposase
MMHKPAETITSQDWRRTMSINLDEYLNNPVEQDHWAIKRRTRPMLGFKTFR